MLSFGSFLKISSFFQFFLLGLVINFTKRIVHLQMSSVKSKICTINRLFDIIDIQVAGGNSHLSSKRSPIELQLETSVLPPTMDQVN